ncbi:hypothetical protein ACJVDH_00320 [Pedobacter sp. AW1-32]|uniref:hypothetical protein n=1 Tax=Pedobacter sp. AW1-32 TaxID=3383026 RepID=UPI003FEEC9FB
MKNFLSKKEKEDIQFALVATMKQLDDSEVKREADVALSDRLEAINEKLSGNKPIKLKIGK